uniref:MULE transposase domain-containing protein n=1 Tax=Romanomermis culicivorax TaxID=13658 RepID=A0A915ID48_ROMCU
MNVKRIAALAYVHEDHIVGMFVNLQEAYENDDDLMGILNYFKDNYIRCVLRNRGGTPRFPIPLWNCHELLADGLPRTNNAVEGWHQAFQ